MRVKLVKTFWSLVTLGTSAEWGAFTNFHRAAHNHYIYIFFCLSPWLHSRFELISHLSMNIVVSYFLSAINPFMNEIQSLWILWRNDFHRAHENDFATKEHTSLCFVFILNVTEIVALVVFILWFSVFFFFNWGGRVWIVAPLVQH